MDNFDSLWPTTPKIHQSVVKALKGRITPTTPFGTIFTMVELAGITEHDDTLVTARALRDMRNEMR